MRASTASTTSTGETFFLRIIAASVVAGVQQRSSLTMERPSRLLCAAQARIERVAQGVTEQVRAEDGEADRDPGEQDEVRRLLGVLRGGDREHPAPRRIRLGHAEPEERQRGLDENGAAELRGREHDERADGVRQDVAERDAQVPEAERARGLDVLHLADRE